MRRFWILFFCVTMIFPCGCHTIRKKFVRKKKIQKTAPVYVDFKEYSKEFSLEAYNDYYLFVRGWIEELISALNKGTSFKRQKRAVDEIIINTEQIMAFYNQEGKSNIYPLYEDFLKIREEIEKSPQVGEIKRTTFIKKLEHLKRKFESSFNYNDAKEWIFNQPRHE